MHRAAQAGKGDDCGLFSLGLLVPCVASWLYWVLYTSGCAHRSSSPTLLYNERFMDPHTRTLAQDQQATAAQEDQATFVQPKETELGIGHCPSISQAV